MNKKYLAFDIGCIECGEDSTVIGLFNTEEEAREAIDKYITHEPNEFGTDWGRRDWMGQHSCEVFEIEINEPTTPVDSKPVTQTPNLEEIKKNLEEALPYTSSVLGELPIRDLIKFFIELFTPLLATKEHDEELLRDFREWIVNQDFFEIEVTELNSLVKEFISSRKEVK